MGRCVRNIEEEAGQPFRVAKLGKYSESGKAKALPYV